MANCLQVGRVTPCAPQFVFARTAGRGLAALPVNPCLVRVHPCPSVVKMALPDLIEIVPLDKPVRAEITVPGSKSITNRALILAALADGEVTLEGALWSEDTQIMVECLQELGFMVNVAPDPNEICNRTITVYGQGGKVPGGGTAENPLELFVGNAGTAARFLAALVCLGKGVYGLHGVPRMHERPQAALFKALRELGYRVDAENGNDKLPARIFGSSRRESAHSSSGKDQSRLTSAATVSIEESSQFASALLLCAKHGGWQIEVTGENTEESPYVWLTENVLSAFNQFKISSYLIEPDASSASYFQAAGWLLGAAFTDARDVIRIKEDPVGAGLVQIDKMFLNYFRWANYIGWYDGKTKQPKVTEISRLKNLGDSIMTAIVMIPFAAQEVKFTDLGRLRVQECERVVALRTELTKCGAKVEEKGDTLTVYPSKLYGAEIETYNDHRMAMCFAILGLKVPGIKIKNPACVKKTFPNFFQKLAAPPPKGLGATILDARTGRKLKEEELFAD
jgi:3-phosphoshikimate 1-carboxyvinyltransferase